MNLWVEFLRGIKTIKRFSLGEEPSFAIGRFIEPSLEIRMKDDKNYFN